MTFDSSKPCTTRDGRPARVVCTDRVGERPIGALISAGDGSGEFCEWYYADGWHNHYGGFDENDRPEQIDLINIPETRWVNIYSGDGEESYHGELCTSRKEADSYATKERIACIEFTEGEGL